MISFAHLQYVKGQYPVTAHVPNFDFLTGCREFKWCEESKRTLKNRFASHLAEFDTTLTLPRTTDQRSIVPVKFRFGRNRTFLAFNSLPLARGPREGKHYNASWTMLKAYFSPQLPSSHNRERNTQKWNSKIHGGDWGDLVELNLVKHNILQRRVS